MKKRPASNLTLHEYDRLVMAEGFTTIAGADEAGRGPLAGPVVAGAVIIKDFHFETRIDDSKKLSSLQRDRAFQEILSKCIVSHSVVENDVVDKLNIAEATRRALEEACEGLREKPDLALVDGPLPVSLSFPARQVVHGDALSLSIACASIVAKVTRDRIMQFHHDLFPEYGFDQHKGYGTPMHMNTLQTYGPCPIHRRSFAPVSHA